MHSINNGGGDMKREAPSMSLLQGSSNFNIHNSNINQIHGNASLNHIHGNITVIRFGDDQFTKDQRNWISDILSTHIALPNINDNLNRNFLTQLIINLPRAEAVFDDYRNKKKSGPCFEGTRVALLREIADWVTDIDGSRMYILSGLAGIGKSTVAYTIASRAAELNLLGASFFFSRDEADRNNAQKLFTTIAYQLCVYNEVFAKAIGDVLQTERGSAATTKDPQGQLRALILDPLRSIVRSRTRPILVVVDALDECDEDDGYAVIMGLSQLVRDLPPFKVILTTRPKPYLDYFLRKQCDHKLLHLQDIEDKVVDSDIRLYLKHSLSLEQVRERYHRGKWCANDEEIDTLVHAAGRLFIIASTAVRYILDKTASNPAGQMQNLLRSFAKDRTPFKDLDHFYTVILRNVVPVDCDDEDIVGRYQLVVGVIIFIQQPLPVSTLTHLINMDENDIHAVLDHLQSVILISDDNVPRIYHKSFPDYLTDQARCKDDRLRIDAKAHHTQIASRCFEIANKHLKYNILHLGTPARYMSNKDGLEEDRITDVKLQEKIPQQLRYACVYWIDHLQVATIENTDLMSGLSKFMVEHTLHWFETLSLIGNLDSAPRALRTLRNLQLLNLASQQLLSDALRFISNFYQLIERSALHMYYSALPFSPTNSLLYRQFIKETEHKTFIIEGGPEKWDGLVASSSHGEPFNFIKFSHDSTLFFSCLQGHVADEEKSLKIWDAVAGIPICTIPGQRFAVSNDFSTIASWKADIITYYNTNGSEKGAMFTSLSKVDHLALSDCGRIAAVLADRTVLLWETKDAESIHIFDEFKGGEDQVRLHFSSTGTRLAYSSQNGSVIKLRDGMSGRFIADLQSRSLHKFVFSGDGSRIASISQRGLTMWSSESGALIGGVGNMRPEHFGCLAISNNGFLLATPDSNGVALWGENSGYLAQIKVLECSYPFSMAFSLDDILAIGSDNIKLYDVKIHSFIRTFPFPGLSTAFSPDCTRFAHGGFVGQICLWDIQAISTSDLPLNGAAAVTVIAISRDCSRLACGYEDSRVELWDTNPSMQRIASHQSHIAFDVEFRPDGRLFSSASFDGTIKLWNGGDGSLHGTIQAPSELKAVALSNSMLVTAGDGDITLWSLDTLSLIYSFQKSSEHSTSIVSISSESDLVAIGFYHEVVDLFDVVNRRTIATFKVPNWINKMTFLPDRSYLMVQLDSGDYLSFNLVDKCITEGPMFEHLIQLPDIPLWHGVPIWCSVVEGQRCFSALFSQCKNPVPVLWIPSNLLPLIWAEGSSMIALRRRDRRVILLRLSTGHKEDKFSEHDKGSKEGQGKHIVQLGTAGCTMSGNIDEGVEDRVEDPRLATQQVEVDRGRNSENEDKDEGEGEGEDALPADLTIRRLKNLFGYFGQGRDNAQDGFGFGDNDGTELIDSTGVD